MLRALEPSSMEARSPLRGRIGLGDLVDKDVFERLRGVVPAQPGDKSRVWGVNSFAELPMFAGVFCEDVSQLCGYRAPASSRQESGTRSGPLLAIVDPDASVTAPGGASYVKEGAAGGASSEVSKHADISGKVFVKRFGFWAAGPNGMQVLVENATGCADMYALGAGFRRGASRVGVPSSRAARFVRDVPESMASPGWCLFESSCSLEPSEVAPRSVLPVRGSPADVRALSRFVVQ